MIGLKLMVMVDTSLRSNDMVEQLSFFSEKELKKVNIIDNFNDKKLIDYLEDGMKILIRFGHGWGDTQMFMPIMTRLRELYPRVHFDIYIECGQEEIFESYPEKDSIEHDLVFSLHFPMSEGSGMTKSQLCCTSEIGIEPISEIAILPSFDSPFVAVHFHGTALPDSVRCPHGIAGLMWEEIIEFGKVPIECHYKHIFHNPVNEKYGFITRHVRDCKPTLSSLIGLIQHSFAFIGVASGPFVTALSIMPKRTIFLENRHILEDYTKEKLKVIKINEPYKEGTILKWLNDLDKKFGINCRRTL
jgi:hypothetical protein